jgi:type IV secretory pathway VirB4 component
MFKVETIAKDWKEAGSLQAQINLFGFWDEWAFLTKSGDLGAVLHIGGMDYESLERAALAVRSHVDYHHVVGRRLCKQISASARMSVIAD